MKFGAQASITSGVWRPCSDTTSDEGIIQLWEARIGLPSRQFVIDVEIERLYNGEDQRDAPPLPSELAIHLVQLVDQHYRYSKVCGWVKRWIVFRCSQGSWGLFLFRVPFVLIVAFFVPSSLVYLMFNYFSMPLCEHCLMCWMKLLRFLPAYYHMLFSVGRLCLGSSNGRSISFYGECILIQRLHREWSPR